MVEDDQKTVRREEPERLRPASKIPVCAFREILLWPFVLTPDDTRSGGREKLAGRMREIACAIAREDGWEAVPDLVDHVDSGPGAETSGPQGREHPQAWGEIVYFHDFVQRALYHGTKPEEWPDDNAPILLLRDRWLKRLEVDVRESRMHFAVERCNLYLFPSGVAILALEVNMLPDEAIHLSDVQNFMDFFRRWHVPYWSGVKEPGLLPERVAWSREEKGALQLQCHDPSQPDFRESHTRLLASDRRAPHPLRHWLAVLPSTIRDHLASTPAEEKPALEVMQGFHWRAISDERMITTNFIIVPAGDFERIHKSDWVRLCFADSAGGEDWPYLIHDGDWKTFRKEHVFDWFLKDGTRQLFAGFNHTIVCAQGGFPENTLVHHFRRHYFQMALLAQFEFATLLAFSSRVTRAVEDMRGEDGGGEEAFREKFLQIRREFLRFVHEFRFTGVSNQMQARAMYDQWRAHLGLDELFHDVEDELRTGNDYLLAIESREQSEAALQQSDASLRLNIIAGLGVALGLPLAFASTSGFRSLVNEYLHGEWFAGLGIIMLFTLLVALIYGLVLLRDNKKHVQRLWRSFVLPLLMATTLIATCWIDIPGP